MPSSGLERLRVWHLATGSDRRSLVAGGCIVQPSYEARASLMCQRTSSTSRTQMAYGVWHHVPADEAVLDRQQMRVLLFVDHVDIVQLDVQILIDRVQRTADGDVVLELDDHLLVGERLEERVEQL